MRVSVSQTAGGTAQRLVLVERLEEQRKDAERYGDYCQGFLVPSIKRRGQGWAIMLPASNYLDSGR